MKDLEVKLALNSEDSTDYEMHNDSRLRMYIDSVVICNNDSQNNQNSTIFLFVLTPDSKSEQICKINSRATSDTINLNKKLIAMKNCRFLLFTNDKNVNISITILGKSEVADVDEKISVTGVMPEDGLFNKFNKKDSYNKLTEALSATNIKRISSKENNLFLADELVSISRKGSALLDENTLIDPENEELSNSHSDRGICGQGYYFKGEKQTNGNSYHSLVQEIYEDNESDNELLLEKKRKRDKN